MTKEDEILTLLEQAENELFKLYFDSSEVERFIRAIQYVIQAHDLEVADYRNVEGDDIQDIVGY